jgi:hypothetical protein
MQDFGLLGNLLVVGASGTVTSQNIAAIGAAADELRALATPLRSILRKNKKSVEAFKGRETRLIPISTEQIYGLIYFYKAVVERAKSTETDKVSKRRDEGPQVDDTAVKRPCEQEIIKRSSPCTWLGSTVVNSRSLAMSVAKRPLVPTSASASDVEKLSSRGSR